MFKEQLEQQQPVVYHTLKNALENDKLAHAYMFSGQVVRLKNRQLIF